MQKQRELGQRQEGGRAWARPANKALIREINASRILDVLRTNGATTRSRLADQTGLSAATVTQITANLIASGRVREADSIRALRGRPAHLLELDPTRVRVIGIDVSDHQLSAVALDLTGAIVLRETRSRGGDDTASAVDDIAAVVHDIQAELTDHEVVGLGLAVSGTVDAGQGMIVHSGLLGWDDVPLALLVEDRVELPTRLARYVDCLAWAITLFGDTAAQRLVIVNVAPSIGVSLVLAGQIQRQHLGRSSAIAHARVDLAGDGGRECHCGRHGCVETVASQWGISALLRERSEEVPSSEWAYPQSSVVNETLAHGGTVLGRVIAGIARVLDAERVVVAAPAGMQTLYAQCAQQAFEAEFDSPSTTPAWAVTDADEVAAARGAACRALADVFYVDVNALRE